MSELSSVLNNFSYGRLLAYCRGEVHDPRERAFIEEQLATDPCWQAHHDSLRQLDLEQIAAWQDARDLEQFTEDQATEACRAVASSQGKILLPLVLREQETVAGWRRKEWARHVDQCVFCRRMRRQVLAQVQARQAGLPPGELLLRDWLLGPQYQEQLEQVKQRLVGAPVDLYVDGPTVLCQTDAGRFVEQIEPVARLLLEEVLHTPELTERFLAYLRREEILARLRKAEHVRDEIGRVLAAFCREEQLADPIQVEQQVTRELVEKVLWRVAVERLRAVVQEEGERKALEAVSQQLEDRSLPPARAIDQALADALPGHSDRALRLWSRLHTEHARLSN